MNEQPDTVMSVLSLFQTSNEGIEKFSKLVATEVWEGRENPLDMAVKLKTLEKIAANVRKMIQEEINTAAARNGNVPFEYKGATLQYGTIKTDYDFSVCSDPDWEEWHHQEMSAANSRKDREKWLMNVREPFKILDERTGEVVTINPPLKRQTDGIKITIK